MFRRLAPALTLFLAACGGEPRAPVDITPPPSRPATSEHQHGHLIGLSAQDLGELFGVPNLQVREGAGLKLQYRGPTCVLDAFLYRPESGAGIERVAYVDARLKTGPDISPTACEAEIEQAR